MSWKVQSLLQQHAMRAGELQLHAMRAAELQLRFG